MVNLENQTLMPGPIEAHSHPVVLVTRHHRFVDVGGAQCKTVEDVRGKIRTKVVTAESSTDPAARWCVFVVWDPELIPSLPVLDLSSMNGISNKVPIMIITQNYHSAWVNQTAFDEAGIDKNTPDPTGGMLVRDKDGDLTGQVLEDPAIVLLLAAVPQPSRDDVTRVMWDQWKEYSSQGFTTVAELAYRPNRELDNLLHEVASSCDCPIRLAVYVCDSDDFKNPEFPDSDKLWNAGVKLWCDGSPHSGTLAVSEPLLSNSLTKILSFPSDPNYGVLNYKTPQLLERVRLHHAMGKQVAIHAHGERALDQAIRVYEEVMAGDTQSSQDRRHRLEHLGLVTDEQLARSARIGTGLAPSFFVAQLYYYSKSFRDFILGDERTKRWAPLALATKHGLCWSIHQDHPAFPGPPQPFANIKTAVSRKQNDDNTQVFGHEYCVNVKEALKAYTINAAWQIFREKEIGSLEVGKLADFVILSQNPLLFDPEKLEDIKVIETYLGGHRNSISA